MRDQGITIPSESVELRQACERLGRVVRDIQIKAGRKPKPISLGEYLRSLGDDYVFLNENPGP